ncbi:hypothetical protein GY21_00285 [Cryobacterium roopkundense]|uniref:ATP-binding cassette subfamily C protein CydD n=1 Tax=Cryobacterium roopkundense TaxID=1001240 RepID=A0A099JYI5_9MICO|nr:hypothetical protein GY21_00285 [Cryobacterium roopkundense]MBB5640907.1 ATP-binding cassette subfamily C protein CydD [Cryobacterium roopkundense]
MRPLDPRLLRYATAARWFLFVGALLGLAQTLVVVAFAWLLSRVITLAIDGRPLEELTGSIAALAGVIVLRAVCVWLLDVAASRGAARVKTQLRARVLARLAERGPDFVAGRQGVRLATTVTSGLDALDNYFARYLPQLLLTALATPLIVVVMLVNDLASGITVIIVLPLIPVFMVLIGKATQAVQQNQWEALQRLGSGFLDVVGGLGTLKIFGRERRQFVRLRTITEDYRQRTMKVLRVSFLSGFVLELAASLSVALIAVSVGLRLVEGSLALSVGLFVLLLAPEAFLPIRQVGAQFHAAADGLAAAGEVFAILDEGESVDTGDVPTADAADPVDTTAAGLRLRSFTVRRDGRVVVDGLDAEFEAGQLTVISGPSGAGKSTLVAALLGFLPFEGDLSLGTRCILQGTSRSWLSWAGQRPGLLPGTVRDNVALGGTHIDPAVVAVSLAWAGLAELPHTSRLGVHGDGLSGGQAQRLAAARAIYRAQVHGCQVVVFDEPSSALDAEAELALLHGLRQLADQGRVVIVVSHRPHVVAAADRVLTMRESVHV